MSDHFYFGSIGYRDAGAMYSVLLLFNCSARSQRTSCAWRVSPGDDTSRAVQRLAMLMQHKQTRYALEVYFEFCRLLREMGSAAVAQSHPFFLK